jgi:two-component system sensor histidine kinase KdpD
VTGSRNSEYVIRWTDAAARRQGAAWTALHVHDPERDEDPAGLERNIALARKLGAEILSAVDRDVAACIVRHARIKDAGVLVIGKAEEADRSFLGRRSVMEDILRESEDLDVVILRGKSPVPPARRPLRIRDASGPLRGIPTALTALASITLLGHLAQPALGYRSVSILYLLANMALPFVCGRVTVLASAALSALLWNFLFIPPRLTFSIASLEDLLMFAAYFLAAFAGGLLTSRLKEKESALSLRERRMAFLYGFTRAVSRERGIEGLARLTSDYLERHMRVKASVFLRGPGGSLETGSPVGGGPTPGFNPDAAVRCFQSDVCVADDPSRLYIPLGSQDQVLGVLHVEGPGERVLEGENREVLSALAGNLALALERELLAEENERNKMAGESARLSRILLNHVSHELRTPLTTITGSASALQAGAAEDPALRRELLSETMIAAGKLNRIVEDLLAMSRLEAGRLVVRPETAYVGELIGAAREGLGFDLGGRTVTLEETARDAEITADPALLVQVFRNILLNFTAYTPSGSTLRIGAGSAPGETAVHFSDDGPGVSERELPLLFDTFFRGSRGAARPGCGLGLSICRGIVEAHGGSIRADRSGLGGLRIELRLPRKEES